MPLLQSIVSYHSSECSVDCGQQTPRPAEEVDPVDEERGEGGKRRGYYGVDNRDGHRRPVSSIGDGQLGSAVKRQETEEQDKSS